MWRCAWRATGRPCPGSETTSRRCEEEDRERLCYCSLSFYVPYNASKAPQWLLLSDAPGNLFITLDSCVFHHSGYPPCGGVRAAAWLCFPFSPNPFFSPSILNHFLCKFPISICCLWFVSQHALRDMLAERISVSLNTDNKLVSNTNMVCPLPVPLSDGSIRLVAPPFFICRAGKEVLLICPITCSALRSKRLDSR